MQVFNGIKIDDITGFLDRNQCETLLKNLFKHKMNCVLVCLPRRCIENMQIEISMHAA